MKQAKVRFSQHLVTSCKTGRHISKSMYSGPRNNEISYNNFSVIDHAANTHRLRILESLNLLKHKPSLIIDKTAEPLFAIVYSLCAYVHREHILLHSFFS